MNEEGQSQGEIDMERLEKVCEALGEHFETVQIFVTRHNDDGDHGTINAVYGTGNWFARYGQVRDWVVKTEERTRVTARPDAPES